MSEEIRKTETPAADESFDQAAMDEVMKKYDRESNTRVWEGWQKWLVYGVMAAFSLFVIYVTLFATWLDLIRYPSFMGGILLIGYLIFPAKKGVQKVNHIPWYDRIVMALGTAAFFYVVVNAKDLTVRLGMSQLKPYEIAIAVVGILATLELCRRSVGIPILCVAGVFLVYALYYYSVSKGLGVPRAVRNVAVSLFYKVQGGGILATPVQVCSSSSSCSSSSAPSWSARASPSSSSTWPTPSSAASPAARRRSRSSPRRCAAWCPAPRSATR